MCATGQRKRKSPLHLLYFFNHLHDSLQLVLSILSAFISVTISSHPSNYHRVNLFTHTHTIPIRPKFNLYPCSEFQNYISYAIFFVHESCNSSNLFCCFQSREKNALCNWELNICCVFFLMFLSFFQPSFHPSFTLTLCV